MRRNPATRSGQYTYRAGVAQWKAEQAAKLAVSRAEGAHTSLGGGWSLRVDGGQARFVEEEDSRERLVVPAPGSYRSQHVAADLVPARDVPRLDPLEGSLSTWLVTDNLVWPMTVARRSIEGAAARAWTLRDASGNVHWRSTDSRGLTSGDLFFRMKVTP